jgi:glycosyltransferase involved in cell wall biosynthesis
MRILVLDVAAEYGGAFTILMQHIDAARLDHSNQYIFVLSVGKFENSGNCSFVYFPWIKKSWFHRLYFDRFTILKVLRTYNPDRILSLQNITVSGTSIPQTLYLHQPLPFVEKRFRLIENPKFWIYQNIIARMIYRSIQKADVVIVQTRWMRDSAMRITKVSEAKFRIIPPHISETEGKYHPDSGADMKFFFPASALVYKNHKTIIEAAEILQKRGTTSYRVIFTLNGTEAEFMAVLHQRAISEELPIDWIGSIDLTTVYRYYSQSSLVFPSSIETFGLPLLEARQFNCPILASDCSFSREILEGYDRVRFFNPEDATELAQLMFEAINSPK